MGNSPLECWREKGRVASANGFNEEQAFGEHSDLPPTTSNNSTFHSHTRTGISRFLRHTVELSEEETEAQVG